MPLDAYRISIPKRGVLTIDAASALFDTAVALTDSSKTIAALDDDGAGGTDSRLEVLLNAGEYYASLLSLDDGLGDYSISTVFRDPKVCAVDPISSDSTLTAALAGTDCRLRDVLPASTANSRSDGYSITIPEKQSVKFDVTADAFAPVIFVLGGDGKVAASTLSSPSLSGTKASLTLSAAGNYTVIIGSVAERTGSYKLTTVSSPLQ